MRTISFQIPTFLRPQFQVSFLISSLFALILLIVYFSLQPVVPLFYSLAQPNDYLVPKIWLVCFPLLSFAITFAHLFLIRLLFTHERIIPQLFAWSTVVMQVLLAIAFVRILLIII
jgi:hypothetical protein